VAYSHTQQATEAYPYDEVTSTCPIRVSNDHGKIISLALSVSREASPLVKLEENSNKLPLIVFKVPGVVSIDDDVKLIPHALHNVLKFQLEMP